MTCTCAEGYTGVHCEVDIDYCNLTQPCQNNGTCIVSYIALIAISHHGYNFECIIIYNINYISYTKELEGTNYMCSCPDGWTGQNCSVERDECMDFQPCRNGANCKVSL